MHQRHTKAKEQVEAFSHRAVKASVKEATDPRSVQETVKRLAIPLVLVLLFWPLWDLFHTLSLPNRIEVVLHRQTALSTAAL